MAGAPRKMSLMERNRAAVNAKYRQAKPEEIQAVNAQIAKDHGIAGFDEHGYALSPQGQDYRRQVESGEVKEMPFEVYPDPEPAPARASSPAPSEDRLAPTVKLLVKKKLEENGGDPVMKAQLAKEAGERKFEVNLHAAYCASLTAEEWELNGRSDLAAIVRHNEERKEKKRLEKEAAKKCDYVYLTWNPAPDTDPQTAHRAFQKFLSRKGYEDHAYCIEYHGEKSNHVHFHCLIRWSNHQNHQPSRFQQNCVDTFSKWTDINRHTVNIKRVTAEKVVGIWNYICGQKPPEKMELAVYDRVWRTNLGFQDLYRAPTFDV